MKQSQRQYHSKLLNASGRRVAAVYQNGQGYYIPRIAGKFVMGERFQKAEQCAQFIADEKGVELTWMDPQK